jgi:hypothetical protein
VEPGRVEHQRVPRRQMIIMIQMPIHNFAAQHVDYLISLEDDATPYPNFRHAGIEFIYMLSGEVVYRSASIDDESLAVLHVGAVSLFLERREERCERHVQGIRDAADASRSE